MKARAYPVPNVDLMQPVQLVQADLARDHDVRVLKIHGQPGYVVEIRRLANLVQRGVGAGAVLKAWFQPTPQGFSVTVGTDRLEDGAKGAVEWLLKAPALITEGYAAFQKAQVDERIFRAVEHWVLAVARVPIRGPAAVPSAGACPQCRAALPFGARFCPKCALDTQKPASLLACPSCRGPVALDAVFCPSCGGRIASAAKACRKCSAALEGEAMFCSSCGSSQEKAES